MINRQTTPFCTSPILNVHRTFKIHLYVNLTSCWRSDYAQLMFTLGVVPSGTPNTSAVTMVDDVYLWHGLWLENFRLPIHISSHVSSSKGVHPETIILALKRSIVKSSFARWLNSFKSSLGCQMEGESVTIHYLEWVN